MTPDELTPKQRTQIADYFKTNPDGGYKSACRAAGIHRITKTEARRLIETDPDLGELREQALGVDEDSAWRRIALIAKNPEHKDALRANTFILGAIHGRSETSRVEHVGDPQTPIVIAHERRLTLADLAGLAEGLGAGTRGELPAAPEVLAPSDDG